MANPRRIYGGFTVNGVAMGGPPINGEFSSHVWLPEGNLNVEPQFLDTCRYKNWNLLESYGKLWYVEGKIVYINHIHNIRKTLLSEWRNVPRFQTLSNMFKILLVYWGSWWHYVHLWQYNVLNVLKSAVAGCCKLRNMCGWWMIIKINLGRSRRVDFKI